ncbi:uncharacterized protein LOC116852385 isoform X2 [Odontomachus brunneus]|uniref:uncharacterized protein LOC116852385 isoform X2 n=1 Tax=Odontomachus brunneus TaxID=486640 RepID=UPI0013F19AD1|nr:uncharacterized protein LOC116852385 isoform X2 [Odontomachus brunneus]
MRKCVDIQRLLQADKPSFSPLSIQDLTYVSHMKIASKFTVAVPTVSNVWFNTLLNYIYKFMQVYALKPEVLICGMILVIILIYVQAVDVWSRSLLARIHYTLGRTTSKVSKLQFLVDDSINNGVKPNWELKEGYIAAYAMQGHRARMEDRFVVNENMNSTGVSLFAVFDGHGGEFAANYVRDKLISNINQKIIELKNMLAGKGTKIYDQGERTMDEIGKKDNNDSKDEKSLQQKKSFRKVASTSLTDDCMNESFKVSDPELLDKLESLSPITRKARLCRPDIKQILKVDTINYIEGNKINYGKLITDEILTADKLLVEAAKKNMDVAGIYLYIYRVSQTTRTTQFFRKTQYFRKKCFQKKL